MFVGTTDGTDITDTLCFCWDHKLVHSISIHFIRVICGGSIRDEKQHIPADFSILPVNGYDLLDQQYQIDAPETGHEWLTYEMTGNNLIQKFVTGNMFITANNNIRNLKSCVFSPSAP